MINRTNRQGGNYNTSLVVPITPITSLFGSPLTCYNPHHSKNHEKTRQKHYNIHHPKNYWVLQLPPLCTVKTEILYYYVLCSLSKFRTSWSEIADRLCEPVSRPVNLRRTSSANNTNPWGSTVSSQIDNRKYFFEKFLRLLLTSDSV